jgi:hypothetical protein
MKIKARFAKQPEAYKAFLDLMNSYQKERMTLQEVYAQVSHLLEGHADLISDFSQFLPVPVKAASEMAASEMAASEMAASDAASEMEVEVEVDARPPPAPAAAASKDASALVRRWTLLEDEVFSLLLLLRPPDATWSDLAAQMPGRSAADLQARHRSHHASSMPLPLRSPLLQECVKEDVQELPTAGHRMDKSLENGAQPFACNHVGCNKRFSMSSNLRRHLRTCHRSPPAGGSLAVSVMPRGFEAPAAMPSETRDDRDRREDDIGAKRGETASLCKAFLDKFGAFCGSWKHIESDARQLADELVTQASDRGAQATAFTLASLRNVLDARHSKKQRKEKNNLTNEQRAVWAQVMALAPIALTEEQRVAVFLEPIALYPMRDLHAVFGPLSGLEHPQPITTSGL